MPSDPVELTEKWRQRLYDAKLRLEFARSFVKEVSADCASGAIPAADGWLAYRQALATERDALAEFVRIAKILKNLVLHDAIPDEDRDQGTKSQPD